MTVLKTIHIGSLAGNDNIDVDNETLHILLILTNFLVIFAVIYDWSRWQRAWFPVSRFLIL